MNEKALITTAAVLAVILVALVTAFVTMRGRTPSSPDPAALNQSVVTAPPIAQDSAPTAAAAARTMGAAPAPRQCRDCGPAVPNAAR